MALSYEQFLGTGSQTLFTFEFDYLSRSHVKASVDGVEVPFSWAGTYTVQLASPAAPNAVVEIRRTTPRTERLVRFTDGSTLVATDLNTSTLQAFFLAQEAFDQGAASMAVTNDGQYSAQTRRISLVGDPVQPQDVVTKHWAETAMSSQLAQANTARATSVAAKDTAVAAASTSTSDRTLAQTARTDAQAARDSASGHRLNAYNAQVAAEAARDVTVTASQDAHSSKVQAQAARIGAETARAAAETLAAGMLVPPGAVVAFATNTPPAGWLAADGAAVSRTTYASLFAIIGTTFGAGNGSTTFNLPNLNDDFVRGASGTRPVGTREADSFRSHTHTATTASSGAHTHTGTTNSAGDHTHNMTYPYSFGGQGGVTLFSGATQANNTRATTSAGAHTHSLTTSSAGAHTHTVSVEAEGGSETRPRNLALRYCIKT